MNILVISAKIVEYDGRLRELIYVSQKLGKTHYISESAYNNAENKNHHVFIFNGLFKYIFFILYCFRIAKKYGPFDIVISDDRKAIIPTIFIKYGLLTRYTVQDARELYFFRDVRHIVGKIGCIIEKLFIGHFDLCICANIERANIMKKVYNLKSKPLVFENIRRLVYSDNYDENQLASKYKNLLDSAHRKIISTSGCKLDRGTDEIVKAVGSLGNDYRLFLVGVREDRDKKVINDIVKNNHYQNIHIIDSVGQDELKYLISHCDVGIVTYPMNDFNNKYCASGKIYEFLFEGLPVLTSINPPLVSICKKYCVGISTKDFKLALKRIFHHYNHYKKNAEVFKTKIDIQKNRADLVNDLINNLKT